MYIIGVTGAIASGKSEVARMLAQYGAAVINADQVGHQVLGRPEVKAAIHARWGDAVFRPGEPQGSCGWRELAQAEGRWGDIDRKELARRVFAPTATGTADLEYLEGVTHPLIGEQMRRLVQQYRARQVPAVVLDAPLLYKAGWDALCDKIVFVDTPEAVCRARAAQRGWSAADLAFRQHRQPDLAWQRRRADVILKNGGAREELSRQLDLFWKSLFPAAGRPATGVGPHERPPD